jgi:DNA-binding CsgD family transcriptional regulator
MTSAGSTTNDPARLDLGALSDREREVLEAAISGASARELAERLSLSEATVRSHLAHIYGKLGVAGRVELLARLNGRAPSPASGEVPGRPERRARPWRWRQLAAIGTILLIALATFALWRPDLAPSADPMSLLRLADQGQIARLDVKYDGEAAQAQITTNDGRRFRVDRLQGTTLAAIEAYTLDHGGAVQVSPAEPLVPAWLPLALTAFAPLAFVLALTALALSWRRRYPPNRASPPANA